ncbi:hypothetical protein H5410_021377 [Solanum commersonii]|uniref:Uncharacterized protein n=1 Tax=Solanum commersonii TaxID=4109 RepID=A0A9J5ZE32_SOLCO|nr:hypothetical protein H5410_021377 [Solanum commersonii]
MKQTKGGLPSALAIPTYWAEVNPRPFPTHSARESEWAKAEVVLKSGNSMFERNRIDLGFCPIS